MAGRIIPIFTIIPPMSVTLIIPAYNEAERIGRVLEAVAAVRGIDETIVLDDGSSDGTAEVAERRGVIVVRHEKNRGKTEAMKSGAERARGSFLCFLDADLEGLHPSDIERLIDRDEGSPELRIMYRSGESGFFKTVFPAEPMVGGERCMRKEDFSRITEGNPVRGFEFEIACNAYFLNRRLGISIVRSDGVRSVMKWRKYGISSWPKDMGIFLHLLRRFGFAEVGRQIVAVSYRFQWLRLTKGWKNGAVAL